MSHTLSLRISLACVVICSLFVTGLITPATPQSHASNNSLPHSLTTPTINEPSKETGPQTKTVNEAPRSRVSETPGKLPLSFEENRGQVNQHVKYISRGSGYTLFLTPTEAVLALRRGDGKKVTTATADARRSPIPARPHPTRTSILRMKLSRVNRSPAVTGESEMSVKTNYVNGNDPEKGQTGVSRYERVRYAQVYPGVDMIYYGKQQQLEYDFEVAPGGDSRQIELEFDGVKRVKVERGTGDLVFKIGGVEVRQRKPVAYQEAGGERREVPSRYVAKSKNRVRIEVGEYDRARPLVINPVLSYSTYLSSNSQDSGTTFSSDSRSPHQYRKDQPLKQPTNSVSYSIGGRVLDRDGNGIEGMLMALDSAEFSITYTDHGGYYSFDKLGKGSDYMVYPFADNYTFDTREYSFSDLQSNQGADFNALSVSYSISGYVSRSDGIGVEFVNVLLDGTDYNDTYTDYDGYYSFEDLQEGYYTVYPYTDLFTFIPEQQEFYYLQSHETAFFSIQPATISGSVGVAGATVTLTGNGNEQDIIETRTVTSDSGGSYLFTDVPVPIHFLTVKPTLTNYRFDPREYSIFVLVFDETDVDFTPIPRTYSIVGVVRVGAARLPGVTVKLTSPTPAGFTPRTTTTTGGGAYSFSQLPPGRNYTVTPSIIGYQITPARQTIYDLNANQTTVDFAVKVNSITGRITRTGTTTGISGVAVYLTSPTPANFPDRIVRTDSAGIYTFNILPAGRNYTIKPGKGGFTFSPSTRSFTNLRNNIPAGASTNFTGTGP